MKFLVLMFGWFFLVFFAEVPAYGQAQFSAVASSELIERAKAYDGKIVIYQGEIIGEIMKRGKFAWLNINDGQNALGIWIHRGLLKNISPAGGSYFKRGDIVAVSGVFSRACREHGGDLDIHATALVLIASGQERTEKMFVIKAKAVTALTLLVILLMVLGLRWSRKKRVSKKDSLRINKRGFSNP